VFTQEDPANETAPGAIINMALAVPAPGFYLGSTCFALGKWHIAPTPDGYANSVAPISGSGRQCTPFRGRKACPSCIGCRAVSINDESRGTVGATGLPAASVAFVTPRLGPMNAKQDSGMFHLHEEGVDPIAVLGRRGDRPISAHSASEHTLAPPLSIPRQHSLHTLRPYRPGLQILATP
jgi:hypothetical protein